MQQLQHTTNTKTSWCTTANSSSSSYSSSREDMRCERNSSQQNDAHGSGCRDATGRDAAAKPTHGCVVKRLLERTNHPGLACVAYQPNTTESPSGCPLKLDRLNLDLNCPYDDGCHNIGVKREGSIESVEANDGSLMTLAMRTSLQYLEAQGGCVLSTLMA